MDWENITRELNRRFAEPLAEFYKRRIIFWYDEDREFEDKVAEMELAKAKLLILTGTNSFAAKKLLAADDTESNYLVYCPLRFQKSEDNWLLNIALYSEEYRADRNSMWMDEMGLPQNHHMRPKIKEYSKFFQVAEHRARIKAMSAHIATVPQLHLAVMATLCGIRTPQPSGIVLAVLSQGTDAENNPVYCKLKKYGAEAAFWKLVQQMCGYNGGAEPELKKLAAHLLLTAATRTMREKLLNGLEAYIADTHQSQCYDLVADWLQTDAEGLGDIAGDVEYDLRLYQRFSKVEAEELAETECFPCIDECILATLMQEICDGLIRVESIRNLVATRRTKAWFSRYASYYEGLLQVANMQEFDIAHHEGFHLAKPQEIWKAYESDYYRMDSYYRCFHLCFNRSLTMSHDGPDDLFKHVLDVVENLYGKYLNQLSSNWTAVSAEALATQGYIPDVNRQRSFYCNKVESRDRRLYVIISDAMRYEVAAELTEQLRRENQCEVELESMQGIFPTITKFGMAALLPHQKLDVVAKAGGGVSVMADGAGTEMPNRDKVLKAKHPASVALQYKNIIGLKRAARQALVKDMDVVYIYHDKIDEASHSSDSQVFSACEDAINELKHLVRIICNEFGGTRICITADHGFLYTYSPLSELDKVDKSAFREQLVDYGRRYAITEPGTEAEYLMPVKFTDKLSALTPRENVRIKMSGGGLNFVHGGISLQEMVVPVIDFRHLRNASAQYKKNREKYDTKPVTISLLSASRKITNMLFPLSFLQDEAVGDNRIACPYKLYFTDEYGKQISGIVKLIADKENANAQERVYRHNFNLKNLKYNNWDTYYLVIEDESGAQLQQREAFQIDIAMAIDDFNFFD